MRVKTTRLLVAVVVGAAGLAAAVAIAGSVRARAAQNEAVALRADNEASAIGLLREIGAAETRYRQRCGGYANLRELIRAGEFPPAPLTAESTIMTNGYTIAVEPAGPAIPSTNLSPNCIGSVTDFFSRADPVIRGRTGTRYYASDARQTIFPHTEPMTYPPPHGRPAKVIATPFSIK